MRKPYPSDITKEQYEIIAHHIEGQSNKTRPMKYDLYEILCAILYLVKEGVSWRAIPHDFPNHNIVYYHFSKWSKKKESGLSSLDDILADITVMERLSNDREAKPSVSIVDSKSIPNASSAGIKGYDAGKKLRA
jgi:hypothetical protein